MYWRLPLEPKKYHRQTAGAYSPNKSMFCCVVFFSFLLFRVILIGPTQITGELTMQALIDNICKNWAQQGFVCIN